MKASPRFQGLGTEFWAYARLISERVGYSREKEPLTYTFRAARDTLHRVGVSLEGFELCGGPTGFAESVIEYLNHRSSTLSSEVRPFLMNGPEASRLFEQILGSSKPKCPLPMNKQKGAKKHYNYLTCMVNVLTERTLGGYYFDGDPQRLAVIMDGKRPVTTMARRLDGAYPGPVNARAVWEIKEYYDNKSFGSRIADGVYETLLDGYELAELPRRTGVHIKHYLIIDSYDTWWLGGGIPYLCRLADALHMGLVDEIVIGKQVIERWPAIVRFWLS